MATPTFNITGMGAPKYGGTTSTIKAVPLTGKKTPAGTPISVADKESVRQDRLSTLQENVGKLEKTPWWNVPGKVKNSWKSMLSTWRVNAPITDADVEQANQRKIMDALKPTIAQQIEDEYKAVQRQNTASLQQQIAQTPQKLTLPAAQGQNSGSGAGTQLPGIQSSSQMPGAKPVSLPAPIRYVKIPTKQEQEQMASQKAKEMADDIVLGNLVAKLAAGPKPTFFERVDETVDALSRGVLMGVDSDMRSPLEKKAMNIAHPKSGAQEVAEGALFMGGLFIPYTGIELGAVKVGKALRSVGAVDDAFNAYPYLMDVTTRNIGVAVGEYAWKASTGQEYGAKDFLLNIGMQGVFDGVLGQANKVRIMSYLDNEVFKLGKELKRAPTPDEVLTRLNQQRVPGMDFTWGHWFAEHRLAYKSGIDPNSAMPQKGRPGIDFSATPPSRTDLETLDAFRNANANGEILDDAIVQEINKRPYARGEKFKAIGKGSPIHRQWEIEQAITRGEPVSDEAIRDAFISSKERKYIQDIAGRTIADAPRKAPIKISKPEAAADALDDVPLSKMSPQGMADAATSQKVLDAGGTIDEAMAATKAGTEGAQQALPEGRQVVQFASGNPDEIVRGLRVAKVNSLDAQRAMRNALEQHPDIMNSRTRGIITNAETVEKARKLHVSKDELLNLPEGAVLNAEQRVAMEQLIAAHAGDLRILKELADVERVAGDSFLVQKEYARAAAEHLQLLAVKKGVATELGRAVQSHRVVVDPVSNLRKKLEELIAKSDNDTAGAIFNSMVGLDPNDYDGMRKLLVKWTRPRWIQMLRESSVAAKLWRVKTQVVNITSNSLQNVARPIFKTFAAGADVGRVAIMRSLNQPAQRERFFAEAIADIQGQLVGFWSKDKRIRSGLARAFYVPFKTPKQAQAEGTILGWKQSMGEAWKALLDEQYIPGGMAEDAIGLSHAIKGHPSQSPWLSHTLDYMGKVVRMPFRLLNTADVAFRTINYSGEIAGQAARIARKEGLKGDALSRRMVELLQNPTEEMMLAADTAARKAVFQEPLGVFTRKIQEMRNIPVFGDVLTITMLPFFKPLANLLKRGFDPINPFMLARGLKKGGGEASEAMARSAIGAATLYTLFQYSLDEKLTGAPPADLKLREELYAQGWQPWSIRIGDTYYSYDRIEPFGQLFRMVAAVGDAYRETGEVNTEMIGNAFLKMGVYTLDRSYIRGMYETMNAMFDPDRYADQWLYSFIYGNIPFSGTLQEIMSMTDINQAGEQIIREKPESLTEYLKSKIPGYYDTLDPRFDSQGRPVTIKGNRMMRTFSPVRVTEGQMTQEEINTITSEYYKIKRMSKESSTEESIIINQALKYMNEWSELPSALRAQNYKVLKQKQPDVAKQYMRIIGKDKGVSFIESTLKNRDVATRVKYLKDLQKQLDKKDFAKVYADWKKKGIITDAVKDAFLKP